MELGQFSGLDEMLSREWIITNGIGGYASSTVAGINTRRYHGLLAVPFSEPPFDRMMVLAGVEEEFSGDVSFHLSSSEYQSTIHPDGYTRLVKFSLKPFPSFRYEHGGVRVKKTIFMPYGKNATVIRYEVENPGGFRLKLVLRPIVSFRSIHSMMRCGQVQFKQWETNNTVEISSSETPFLILSVPGMPYIRSSLPEEQRWYRNVLHREERERGYDFLEDCYCSGYFESRFRSSADFTLIAAGGKKVHATIGEIMPRLTQGPASMQSAEEARLEGLIKESGLREMATLVRASDSFLANNRVIAGYHWFGCWGRDTLISLPGLTLATRRYGDARRILLDMGGRARDGLLPNWFDGETAEYGPIDVSLLYIYAFHKYLCYTYDLELARRMWKFLLALVENLMKGTCGTARMDRYGLIVNESKTWMDAVVGGSEVTPRRGKVVEINAMWYNALRSMEEIGKAIGEKFPHAGISELVRESFTEVFWNPSGGYLYDFVYGEPDGRVRPNQIFAVSMPFPVVGGDVAISVVNAVRTRLLTRGGLRSLAQGEPGYRGRCAGNQAERDLAYHQGTVWGWLIGPFITAFIRTGGNKQDAAGYLKYLAGPHLTEAGLCTISEIFDGDEPHTPRGCISQAWSVAEVLRAYSEDILWRRPEYEGRLGVKRDRNMSRV